MKLINRTPIAAIFLLAAISCSTEEDLMNGLAKQQETTAESNAYLSFSVNVQAVQTKASVSNPEEETLADVANECSIILFNADNTVYAAYDHLAVKNGQVQLSDSDSNPFLIQVKVGKGETNKTFKVVAVANTDQEFAGLENYDAVKAQALDKGDMYRNVKISELTEITVPRGYATLDEAIDSPFSVPAITVKQLTARVELESFTVSFPKTRPVDIKIKSVQLLNQNVQSYAEVNNEENKDLQPSSVFWEETDEAQAVYTAETGLYPFNGLAEGKPSFNTFPNYTVAGEEGATAIRFTLVYDKADGTSEKTFTFAINRPTADGDFTNNSGHDYIKAGYIYQVKVNASLTSNALNCSAILCVKDWREQTFEYIMQE